MVKRFGIGFAPAGTLRSPAGTLRICIGRSAPNTSAPPMTEKQLDTIIRMVAMILDGCKDLEEAKQKLEELLEDQKKED